MAISLVFDGSPCQAATSAWLASLSPDQVQELATIIHTRWMDGLATLPDGVVEDWIEEHGGLREWYANLLVTQPLPKLLLIPLKKLAPKKM